MRHRTPAAWVAALMIVAATSPIAGCLAPVDPGSATGGAQLDPTVPAQTASDTAGAANKAIGQSQDAVEDLAERNDQ